MKNLIFVLALLPSICFASEHTLRECKEGSDFIKNAAISRDNGINGKEFINKLVEDIEMINSFPVKLRWFVRDEKDADFLLDATIAVFHWSRSPSIHEGEFYQACLLHK